MTNNATVLTMLRWQVLSIAQTDNATEGARFTLRIAAAIGGRPLYGDAVVEVSDDLRRCQVTAMLHNDTVAAAERDCAGPGQAAIDAVLSQLYTAVDDRWLSVLDDLVVAAGLRRRCQQCNAIAAVTGPCLWCHQSPEASAFNGADR